MYNDIGILVDSEIVLSTRYGKTRVTVYQQEPYQQRPFINKTLSTETSYQQGLIVGKIGSGMRCSKLNSTSTVLVYETQRKCLFRQHQVNHGGVQKTPVKVSLYKYHTTEEPLCQET